MQFSISSLVRVFLLGSFLLVLLADKASAAQATVTWADTATNESGFKIERKVGTAGTFSTIATTSTNILSYVDTNLSASTTYCYRVRAYNSAGSSAYSNEVCVTTPVQKYRLSASMIGSGTLTGNPAGINCPTDCTEDYASGTQVTLTPSAVSGWKFASWGGDCTGQGNTCVLTMSATKNVTANFQVVPPQITLTWADTATNESGFKIERKTGTAGTYSQIALTAANNASFVDTNLSAGTTYCYRVRAYNTAGTSGYSNEMCGTTR